MLKILTFTSCVTRIGTSQKSMMFFTHVTNEGIRFLESPPATLYATHGVQLFEFRGMPCVYMC